MDVIRVLAKDPRTVGRDIPGIFDALFPQLIPGIVAHYNRRSYPIPGNFALPDLLIRTSSLNRAMLFEVAFARAEQLIAGSQSDWGACLQVATARQRRHFDANLPERLSSADVEVAEHVASNLWSSLQYLMAKYNDEVLISSPAILGFQWIASGTGDFSLGQRLIEIKCSNRHFSSADYRQVVMYWLLSYAAAIESKTEEWENLILLNPRMNYVLELSFEEVVTTIAAGRSKVELLELLGTMVGKNSSRTIGM